MSPEIFARNCSGASPRRPTPHSLLKSPFPDGAELQQRWYARTGAFQ